MLTHSGLSDVGGGIARYGYKWVAVLFLLNDKEGRTMTEQTRDEIAHSINLKHAQGFVSERDARALLTTLSRCSIELEEGERI